jgi:hypothetical protein
VAVVLIELASRRAMAQPFDVERPLVVVVGAPGGARMTRLDRGRRGLATSPLPASSLATEWQVALGFTAQQGPLVDSKGRTYVVGDNCEVVGLASDGVVLWRAAAKGTQPGPAVLLSDNTLVFADSAGEAVAVREGAIVWRSRFGRASASHAAPLPLDDGGVVVASGPDLAVLDAEGGERTRVVLPETTSHPLISTEGKVLAIGDSGAVWAWVPGEHQANRVGSFGSDIEGSAAVFGEHILLAASATQTHLSTVDLASGTAATLVGPLGGLWLGSPAVDGRGTIYDTQSTASGEAIVALDAAGVERGRALVAAPTRAGGADRAALGAGSGARPSPIVDSEGHIVFATTTGAIGVVSGLLTPGATVGTADAPADLIAEACTSPARAHGESAVVGMAPLPLQRLVVVCKAGLVIALKGGRQTGSPGGARL